MISKTGVSAQRKGERRGNTIKRLFLVVVVLVLAGMAWGLGGDSVESPSVEESQQEIIEVTRVVAREIEVTRLV